MHWVGISIILLSAYSWPNPSVNLTVTWVSLQVRTGTATAKSWTHLGDKRTDAQGCSFIASLIDWRGLWTLESGRKVIRKHFPKTLVLYQLVTHLSKCRWLGSNVQESITLSILLFPHVIVKKTNKLYKSCLFIVSPDQSTKLLR